MSLHDAEYRFAVVLLSFLVLSSCDSHGRQPAQTAGDVDQLCRELVLLSPDGTYYIPRERVRTRQAMEMVSECIQGQGLKDVVIPVPKRLYSNTTPPPVPFDVDAEP